MSMIGEAYVRIRPIGGADFTRELDRQTGPGLRRFENQLRGSNRELTRFSRGALVGTGALQQLGRAAAFASISFIGGAGVVVGLKSAVDAASNLEEQLAKTKVVFGDAADGVIAFSEDALLLARDRALETASSIGALLRPLGVIPKQAAETSVTLTKLGVDLSSFYNTSVADALQAIKSGLVGEVEPLRRYGVVLSEARVQQKALNDTGKESVEQLTNQEKVLARVNLILRDTAQAQGDAERTAGGFANQQRELQKNIRNTQILLGQTLIPTLTDLTKNLNEWLGQTENQERLQRKLASAVEVTTTVVGGFADGIETVAAAYRKLRDAPGGDTGLVDLFRKIPGLETGSRKLGEDIYFLADALGVLANVPPPKWTAADLLRMKELREQLKPVTGIFGVGYDALNQFTPPPPQFPQPMSDADRTPGSPRAAPGTRGDLTATALARAQAEGTIAEIKAAAEARLGFIRDTISFANRLIASGRGDTAKLYTTLQKFYADEASTQGIIDGIAEDAADARKKRIQDAIDKGQQHARDAIDAYNRWRAARQEEIDAIVEGVAKQRGIDQLRAANAKERQAVQEAIQEQILQNNLLTAQLIPNEKKRLAAEKAAQMLFVQLFRDRARQYKTSTLAGQQAIGEMRAAKLALANLGKRNATDTGGFSLQELFREASEEFELYGSNVGSGPLSPQDARGAFAGTVKTHQTTVVQNFYGERGAGQALSDAARVAKNMKD